MRHEPESTPSSSPKSASLRPMVAVTFTCPKCGTHMFGTAFDVRHCHGPGKTNCPKRFQFNRREDWRYFTVNGASYSDPQSFEAACQRAKPMPCIETERARIKWTGPIVTAVHINIIAFMRDRGDLPDGNCELNEAGLATYLRNLPSAALAELQPRLDDAQAREDANAPRHS